MAHRVHVTNERGTAEFDLDEKGWVEKYREYLDGGRITLLNGASISVNTVGRRWVMFYRTIGHMTGGRGQIRLLCLGWQERVKGVDIKALNWIYPNGFVEVSEEPTLWQHFI